MRGRATIGAVVVLALTVLAGPPASADPADFTLGSTDVELTPTDGGGGTTKIALTNLTAAKTIVTARAETPPNDKCKVDLDQSGRLGEQQSQTFKATITKECGSIEGTFNVIVTAAGKDLPVVAATVKNRKTPDWDALEYWFVTSTVAMAVLMLIVGVMWCGFNSVHPFTSLPYLEDSWSFKDSWVSNVTVVGGLLAGVFGASNVVKAMLGEDADEAVALATIGGAVSVAMIGAAGVLVIAFKSVNGGNFTAIGVLLGSALALGGAGGQLGVVYESARDLDLGGIEDNLAPYFGFSGGLLVFYGFISVLGVLIQGYTKPDDADPGTAPVSETVFAAAVVATALRGDKKVTRGEVNTLLRGLEPKPSVTEDTGELDQPEGRPPVEVEQQQQPEIRSRRRFAGPVPSHSRRAALP